MPRSRRSRSVGASSRRRPARSRARSASRPRAPRASAVHVSHVRIAAPAQQARAPPPGHLFERTRPVVRLLVSRRAQLAAALLVGKQNYFDGKDVKESAPQQKEYDQVVRELQLAVAAMRAGLGNRPIRIRLAVPMQLKSTVTSGVVNTVLFAASDNSVNPSYSGEFNTLATIFDEYRTHGGHIVWIYADTVGTAEMNSAGSAALPAIGFDVSNSGAASSTAGVAELAMHKLYSPGVISSTTASIALATAPNYQTHSFSFKQPAGVTVSDTSSNNPGTQWLLTNTPTTQGYIKHYHTGSIITATTVGVGIMYIDCEFRCRT